MIFDIHTKEAAQGTLQELTGIVAEKWESYLHEEDRYTCQDDFVKDMLQKFCTRTLPQSYADMKFVFFHITTSENACESIKKAGLTDLKRTYQNRNSELRIFLDTHDISIDLCGKELFYKEKCFKIDSENHPADSDNCDSVEYKCWSIGRKFYEDHAVCGFLSTRDGLVYEGRVHKRPEILMDIDALLGTQLALEWERSHSAYKVIARVNGHDICYAYEDEQSEEEKIMAYIVMAYNAAFKGGDENIVLMKDGVQIPACDILTIESFQEWD